jgi:hypothetical protein
MQSFLAVKIVILIFYYHMKIPHALLEFSNLRYLPYLDYISVFNRKHYALIYILKDYI